MTRTLLYLAGGAILGGIIHLVVILILPALAADSVWDRIGALGARNTISVLAVPGPGEPNPLGLDPELAYAVCELDLSVAPGYVDGILPDGFWSVAVHDRRGTVLYSTTNRDGLGRTLDLGIFNAAQTRLLAQQEIDISEGLLIVESPADAIFVVVRAALSYPETRPRTEAALAAIDCSALG